MRHFLNQIFILCVVCFMPRFVFALTPVHISELSIELSETFTDNRDTQKLIPFSLGSTTTLEEITDTLERLKKIEWVKNLNYEIEFLSKENIHLKIKIDEYRTVRGVSIRGNYPFLAKQIRRLIPLQPGTIYDENKIEASLTAIKEFLQKNGYYDSTATLTAKPHKKYPFVDLAIRIRKGYVYRFDEVKIEGNAVFSDSRLRNKVFRTGRFQESHLKKDIRRIDKLYVKKGYIKTRVKLENKQFDANTKTIDLKINVRENKKLILTFSGHKTLTSAKLKEIVGLKESRSYDRFAMEQGRERLIQYFHKNSYPDAEVYPTLFKEGSLVYIDYEIQAGTRVDLTKLHFINNKKISDKRIAKVLRTKASRPFVPGIFDAQLLQKDKKAIEDLYLEEGFFDIKVSDPQISSNSFGDQRFVAFFINEGLPYEVTDVEFYGLPDDSLLFTQKLPLRTKKTYNHKRLLQTQDKILENLFELGYANATIAFAIEKDPATSTLKVIYHIDAHEKMYVRSIVIKGDYKTKLSVIRQNLEFKEGEVFNYQKLLNSQLNLRKLGIFSTVNAKALGFNEKQSQIDVLFEVFEDKSITTNFQAGYDSRNSIRGEFNFTKRNLLGFAKQFNARLIGGLNFNRVETTFLAPRVFGADINLANQYFGEYENSPIFNAFSYGSYVSGLKTFGPKWTLGVKDQVTRSELIESQSNTVALGNAVFDNTLNEFRVFGYYDARDNFSDPQKGIYIYVNNEINTELSNLRNNFDTIEIGITHHKKLVNKLVLNQSLRYGQIFSLTEQSLVPFNELFFLGGSDTLRGFEEDAINTSGGIARFIYNAELHYQLVDAFKLALFFDAGFLEQNAKNISLEDMRESAGLGLRYFTPVGPIRLDYGFILDRQSAEPVGRLHFSFGYFF